MVTPPVQGPCKADNNSAALEAFKNKTADDTAAAAAALQTHKDDISRWDEWN